ncbi:MAG TPA: CoA transferase [Pseudomonadales bacterium]|nr:CoA transferase [Pseudomonadales bacterium]
MAANTQGTLQGLKVIDAASFLAGPCAATIMSDYGADVIKIEPLYGDGHRRLTGAYPIDYTWQLTGRNKRSLALDFTTAAGREVLLKLADSADVILFNLRADQLARYDLSYETLRQRNPRIVYAQISGYGLEGDESARRAFDITGWFARTGILDVMHDKDVAPAPPAGGVGDHATAMTLFGAIMLTLYRREQTGEGGMVSTSLAAMGAWANGLQLAGVLAGFDPTERRNEEGWTNPFSRIYATGDGRHLMLALAAPRDEWPRLAQALGRPELSSDPRFADIRAALKNRRELCDAIASAFATMTIDEVDAKLKAADITFSLVARLRDVVGDPQLIANGLVVATDSVEPGYDRTLATPFKVHDEPQRTPTRAPACGAHSREVLRDLGLGESEIDALIEARVVGTGPSE